MFFTGIVIGLCVWFFLRCIFSGFYTIDQNERGVKTSFGRAERVGTSTTDSDPSAQMLSEEERARYRYPQLRVIPAGGPYFKFPWQRIYKVSIATETVSIAYDPNNKTANHSGSLLEAVTKDQLNTGLRGQIRFSVSERNLYAYLFGIANPVAHVMGFFHSILRERIANFEAPASRTADESSMAVASVQGISINDLRKNLAELNHHMERECQSSVARYGIALDAALITGIDPPQEVESALAAINTAHNQVSSEVSLAQASADQKIVQSRRAVEIETLRAQAEVQLINQLGAQLLALKQGGDGALRGYLRNIRLKLYSQASRIIWEVKNG
jgi:regulator of protease activity HflC (stomatin/prohibitin superfamily)